VDGDLTVTALTSALNGLAERQRVIADNIANINTPGFLAGTVDFETSLRDAVNSGTSPDVQAAAGRSQAPTRQDGNNVNLDEQVLADTDTSLKYNLMVTALNAKFGLLRDAMKG
jgi:flagellar basal-body rod protein FlgB